MRPLEEPCQHQGDKDKRLAQLTNGNRREEHNFRPNIIDNGRLKFFHGPFSSEEWIRGDHGHTSDKITGLIRCSVAEEGPDRSTFDVPENERKQECQATKER